MNHGELDGVNPKVIVLMAGTNNISRAGPLNWFGATGDATATALRQALDAALAGAAVVAVVGDLAGALARF